MIKTSSANKTSHSSLINANSNTHLQKAQTVCKKTKYIPKSFKNNKGRLLQKKNQLQQQQNGLAKQSNWLVQFRNNELPQSRDNLLEHENRPPEQKIKLPQQKVRLPQHQSWNHTNCQLDSKTQILQSWTLNSKDFFNDKKSAPLIDTSTPESLERDFYAWLWGAPKNSEHFDGNTTLFATKSDGSKTKLNDSSANSYNYANNYKNKNLITTSSLLQESLTKSKALLSSTLVLTSTSSSLSASSTIGLLGSTCSPFNNGPYITLSFQAKNPFLPFYNYNKANYNDSTYSQCNNYCTMTMPVSSHHNTIFYTKDEKQRDCKERLTSTKLTNINYNLCNLYDFTTFNNSLESKVTKTTNKINKHSINSHNTNSDIAGSNRCSGTNQLGRTYSPGLPLSMCERERIVDLYRNGWKICDISKQLCVTHSCVSKILQRFRATGTCRPKDAKEGRQESPLVETIRNYRDRLGLIRQSEIREQLIRDGWCQRDSAPSRSSINHILRTKLDVKKRRKVTEKGAQ